MASPKSPAESRWAEWEAAWTAYRRAVARREWGKAEALKPRILRAAKACDRAASKGGAK